MATYRIQFNQRLRFHHARTLVPYLHRLGISELYASPILKARTGSAHGYDVTDPTRLNPELGTEADFEVLIQKLKNYGLGLLLDIVPNHMALSPENPWWLDFLENGLCSPYARFFDIDFDATNDCLKNKVLLPILGSPLSQVLGEKELHLTLERTGFFLQYHDYRLPLEVKSYYLVLSRRLSTLENASQPHQSDFKQFRQITDALAGLPSVFELSSGNACECYRERQTIKQACLNLLNTSPKIRTFILNNIACFNGEKEDYRDITLLKQILERQIYRLDFWQTGRERINYRRFFDISDLIGIRVETPEVFQATHALISRLVREGKVTGLRIDHIDGLYDPLKYLRQLQHQLAPDTKQTSQPPGFYVVVEKILAEGERLPEAWPVSGTTGYDFLNMVNTLFVATDGVCHLAETYSRFTSLSTPFDNVVYERKKQIIKELFPGEICFMDKKLAHLAGQYRHNLNLSAKELTEALIEVTACLPVYRTYLRDFTVSPRDQHYLNLAFQKARRQNPTLARTSFDFLKCVLSLDIPRHLTPDKKSSWLKFVLRWQQLTGAIMAKGCEDTVLYNYNRLLSLNEVGGNPASPGLTVAEFHRRNLESQAHWPYTFNATSTHDTKRSEDVRARINVLAEMPKEWAKRLTRWQQLNQAKKTKVNALPVPEPNLEMLLYQTLVGAWPLAEEEIVGFKKRLQAYLVKASREAKTLTNWLSPNTEYERAVITFLKSILASSAPNEFLKDFLQFQAQIAYYGAINSLAQVLLKITSPGVPDFYQGTELWDFSLVDPDNRRPVNFRKRTGFLNTLIAQEANDRPSLLQQILKSWTDGRVKLYVTYKALNARRTHRQVFLEGDYIPLQTEGQKQEHVCVFARRKGGTWALVVVPRLVSKLAPVGTLPLGRPVGGKTLLFLPQDVPQYWLNVFTGEKIKASRKNSLAMSKTLRLFPVTLLIGGNG